MHVCEVYVRTLDARAAYLCDALPHPKQDTQTVLDIRTDWHKEKYIYIFVMCELYRDRERQR